MPQRPGPLLLFLHGFTHTGASWKPVGGLLGDRYRTLSPDIRGHGAASDREPVDLDRVLEDLATLLPDRCVVAGYSMGGRLALHLALKLPGVIEHLVLVGGSPGLADPAQRAARRRADEDLAGWMERSTIDEVATRWGRTPVLAGLSAELAQRAHRDRLRSTPDGLARALRGLGTGALPSLWDRLDELTMPVTLVTGERDEKFQRIARQMAHQIPRARVVVVPGAGHAVHLEAPARVAELIASAPGADPR